MKELTRVPDGYKPMLTNGESVLHLPSKDSDIAVMENLRLGVILELPTLSALARGYWEEVNLPEKTAMQVKAVRRQLIMEPYDPDARDGDNDGIVQEGTPWERPVGTRFIRPNGQPLRAGLEMADRPRSARLVDADGSDVDYTPTYDRPPAPHLGATIGQTSGTVRTRKGPSAVRHPEPVKPEPEKPEVRTQGRQPARISGTFAEIFPKWEAEIPEIIKAQRAHESSNAYEHLALREIQRRQGFDGFPEVVPASEWQEFVDSNPDHIPIFRGVAPWGGVSASDLVEQFRSGPFFAGNGIYGGGTYTANDAEDVLVYLGRERGDTSTDGLIEMLIRPDARIIEWGDARDLNESGSDLDKHIKDTDDELSWDLRDITNDTGRTAAMFGYDAILVKDKYSGEGDFYILLNRTAVVVKGAEGK